MHAYRPDRALDWLRPALKKCADLGLVVKLHTGDGPYSIPTRVVADDPRVPDRQFHPRALRRADRRRLLLRAVPDGDGRAERLRARSGWCLQSRIVEFTKVLPKHKMLFGTDTPPNEPGMWLRLLEVLCHEPPQGLNLDEDTLEDYLGNNVARMIGLDADRAAAHVGAKPWRTMRSATAGRSRRPRHRPRPKRRREFRHDHRHPSAPDQPGRRGLAPHRHAVHRRAHAEADGRPVHDQRQAAPHRHGLHPAAARQHRLSRRQPHGPRGHPRLHGLHRRADARSIPTASSATSRTTRAGARRTALRSSSSTSRSTASRC